MALSTVQLKLFGFFWFLFSAFVIGVTITYRCAGYAVFYHGMSGIFMAQMTAKNYSVEKTIIYPALFIIGAVCFLFYL